MEARWPLYHVSRARAYRQARAVQLTELARDYWPMPFALLVWVAVSELAWLGVIRLVTAVF
jgi:hypothetical protein